VATFDEGSGNFRARELTQFVNRHQTGAASLEMRVSRERTEGCASLRATALWQILRGREGLALQIVRRSDC
jgi:hypothetical protein